METDYIDLHLHSTFSHLDGFGTIGQIVQRCKELGRNAIAITDHGNISAHAKFEKEARKQGIKPIFGCEFYIVPSLKKENSRSKHHITVLVKNQKGYQNLLQLVTSSYQNFYYKPTIDPKSLLSYADGLIILSGCNSSLFNALIRQKTGDLRKLFELFRDNSEFYIEYQPYDVLKDVVDTLHNFAVELGIPEVVTCDIHYPETSHHHLQKILYCVNQRKTWEEVDFVLPSTMYQRPWEEIKQDMIGIGENIDWDGMLGNIQKIADGCDIELPKGAKIFYVSEQDSKTLLKQKCKEGLQNRKLDDREYVERLKSELRLILSKGFEDYFLIMADLCQWAKEQKILMGPARGSSAGSLVCYILGITEVDSIKHNLLFERFIDESREDFPDVDLDFDELGREQAIEYLRSKYGEENFGHLATFAEFRGKNSLDEVGKAFEVPSAEIEKAKAMIRYTTGEEGSSIEKAFDWSTKFREVVGKYPKLGLARYLEGQYRHLSSSAAGYVIVDDLSKYCAFYRDTICWDKYDAEYLGLMKFDLLVLKTLTIIKRIMDRLGMSAEELYSIPLDDELTLKGFDEADMLGVFQFTGFTTGALLKQVSVDRFPQLVSLIALGRPGPKQAGIVDDFIKRYNGEEKIELIMPEYDKIVEETHGLVIYQEQAMELVREIGGFSWKEANGVRRIIGTKTGDLGVYRDKFIEGAEKKGCSYEVAEGMWNHICTFGGYAFNKSHAVSYAIVAFWTMFFKQHHSLLFYWSSIVSEKKEEDRKAFIGEMEAKGFPALSPDINKSDYDWLLEEDGIRYGLSAIKGIGEKVAQEIIANRPYDSIDDLKKCQKKIVNSKVVRILGEEGLLKGLEEPSIKSSEMHEDGQERALNNIDDIFIEEEGKSLNLMEEKKEVTQMETRFLVKTLKELLVKVKGFIPGRTILPIIQNFLLKTEGSRMVISATDLEKSISVLFDAEIIKDGAICLPAKVLEKVVNTLPDELLAIVIKENKCFIRVGNIEIKLDGQDAEDFPPTPQKQGLVLKIDAHSLGKAIRRTIYACAKDNMRPVLIGVLLESKDDKAWFVAADGFRLAVQEVTIKGEGECKVIIPGLTLFQIEKLLKGFDGEVEITLSQDEHRAFFTFGDIEIVTQCLMGNFPDYRPLIPKEWTTKAIWRGGDITKAALTIDKLSPETNRIRIIVKIDNELSRTVLFAKEEEVGEVNVEIDTKLEGDIGKTALNVSYLIEALKACNGDEVSIEFTTPSSPMIFRPVGDNSYLVVVMPLQTNWEV